MARKLDQQSQHASIAQPRLKYMQLKTELLGQLQTGYLRPGDPLPTVQELSVTHQLAPNTVRRALGELDREGFIDRVRGRGTFVRQDADTSQVGAPVSSRRLDAFALVLPETRPEPFPAMLEGLESAAEESYRQIIVSSSLNDADKQSGIILQLLDKEVAGVVIAPAAVPSPPNQISLLQRHGIPVVFCHRRIEGTKAPLVSLPYEDVGSLAGEAFVEHGHRNLVFLTCGTGVACRGYHTGLSRVAHSGGGTVETVTFDEPEINEPQPYSGSNSLAGKLKEIMSRPDRPTGIMCGFDPDAEYAYMILTRMGFNVPGDISIIGFGGKTRKGAIVSQLTSVVIDGVETGRKAGRLLQEMCAGKRAIDDTEEVVMPISLCKGGTLGPAAKR